MSTQFTNQQRPSLVNVITWMTLASGIVNLFWGLGLTLTVVLGTIGFGLICAPITILPTILGIFEVIYAVKLLSNPPQPVQPSTTIAILEIVCVLAGNIFSVVVGILALVFYNDLTVKEYFARLNGTPSPLVPAAPVPPVPPVPIINPAPIVTDEVPPVNEPPLAEDEAPKG